MTADIFSALSDPTRRSIVEILSNSEYLNASEIYENFENQSSSHLQASEDTPGIECCPNGETSTAAIVSN